jgi:hypothetical protein
LRTLSRVLSENHRFSHGSGGAVEVRAIGNTRARRGNEQFPGEGHIRASSLPGSPKCSMAPRLRTMSIPRRSSWRT